MQRKKSVSDKAKEWVHQKFEINETPVTEPARSMYFHIVDIKEKELRKCQLRNQKANANRAKARSEAK